MSRWSILILVAACGGGTTKPVPTNQPTRSDTRASPVAPSLTAAWIEQLKDPRTRERALLELEQLGDPAAIEAIGAVFVEERSVRPLQVMISLARPLTPADAKAKLVTDYETTGRPASWARALPFLTRAIAEIDEANARSVDAATKAADALGEAGFAEGVEVLLDLARRPPSKKIFQAQIAAVRALGKPTAGKAAVGPGLARLIDVDPPRHPRLATTRDEARVLEERYGMHLALTGAAINALAELRVTTETTALVLALYRTPELAQQLRRALVAAGPSARDMLLEVLAGKHAAVEQLFKARKLARYCGDKDELTGDRCEPVALREFYAALVLGDLHDPRATPALLDALKRPPFPAYYVDEQAGPTQHTAIFDALRKLGSPEAAAPLLAIWSDRKRDVGSRASAMEAYGFVVRGAAGARELATIAADNNADDSLRISAASTLARISTDKGDIAVMMQLARKYEGAAEAKRKQAGPLEATAAAADRVFDKAKQDLDKMKLAVLEATRDPAATAEDIRKRTLAAKQAEDTFKLAKVKHREATAPFKQATSAAKAYLGYARMFQTQAARIGVAIRCAGKAECFAQTLKVDATTAAQHAATYITDAPTWTAEDKTGLVEAEIERGMLELGKTGGAAYTELLLDHAVSDNRIVRQSILLALPKLAKLPCPSCVAKLDAAIRAGEGKATLGELDLETKLVRNYFASATP
jgi:streptomycin 6-kinase